MCPALNLDDSNPYARSYRRYLRLLFIVVLVGVAFAVFSFAIGVPHCQTTYHYVGPKPAGKAPTADQKTDAWYLGVTGWQHIRRGQYGDKPLTFLFFVPLSDCLD